MYSKITDSLTEFLIDSKTITNNEDKIYRYGIKLSLELLVSLLSMLFICNVLKMSLEGVLYMCVFGTVRSFSGGFHFKKFIHCYCGSCIVLLLSLIACKFTKGGLTVCFVLIVLLAVLIYRLTPIRQINLEIDITECSRLRMEARVILLTCISICGCLYYFRCERILRVVMLSLFTNLLAMLLGNIYYKYCRQVSVR